MKVAFDGRVFRHQAHGGVERYATALHDELDKISDVELYVPRSENRYGQHLWVQTTLPRLAKADKCDVIFCPVMAGPIFGSSDIPTVVTIHDLAFLRFPEMYSRAFRNYYKFLIPRVLDKSDAIIALTNHEAENITRQFPRSANKIKVVYSGVEEKFFADQPIKEPVILAVSSLNKHKNIATLIKAFVKVCGLIPHRLVLVGGGRSIISDDPEIAEAVKTVPAGRIIMTGYVDELTLLKWYGRADVFVFPSLFEGFGLPPLEAMASNCLVMVSNSSCIPEVCGEGAIYFDPKDVDQLSNLLARIPSDNEQFNVVRAAGQLRAAKFSWKITANLTLKVLRSVI